MLARGNRMHIRNSRMTSRLRLALTTQPSRNSKSCSNMTIKTSMTPIQIIPSKSKRITMLTLILLLLRLLTVLLPRLLKIIARMLMNMENWSAEKWIAMSLSAGKSRCLPNKTSMITNNNRNNNNRNNNNRNNNNNNNNRNNNNRNNNNRNNNKFKRKCPNQVIKENW